ncbi:MAG: sigma-54-dependent Fis family transcriptional regulator [Calditrichaeota bacterium]|nr:sigma-54-dependent Fis family transcriptional regulator [Calditrichota bacterium]
MNNRILVVDDDEVLLRNLKRLLETRRYRVDTVSNPKIVPDMLQKESYSCILLDVRMPALSGMDLLKLVKREHGQLPVIMISGESTIGIAVEALKIGAYDFIEKPIDPDRLLVSVQNAIEKRTLIEEKENIFRELQENYRMIGTSKALKKVFLDIEKAAEVDAKVLITGESGVGKELVAWAIHHRSRRKAKPYIKVNCAAIPSELLEAELFGHRKGAFTGAIEDRKGKFMAANGGTLFLDEIGDMDIRLQGKLLRVLEENEIEVIGDATPQKVDVRVIAATNKDLEQLIEQQKFRLDLYHRLDVLRIHIPPLRERKEDVLPLAYYYLEKFSQSYNRRVLKLHPLTEELFLNYDWPGNVRELRNLMEKLVIFSEGDEITPETVLEQMKAHSAKHPLYSGEIFELMDIQTAHRIFEKNYLKFVLDKVGWKKGEAARILGIDRSNLYKKLRKHGLLKKTDNGKE